MDEAYAELRDNEDRIVAALKQEEAQFAKTLDAGIKVLEDAVSSLTSKTLPGELIFRLYDTHGFPAGDFILKNIASLVDYVARGYDVFARFGGEEFVVMMRSRTLESAVALAERVRAAIENHALEYTDAPLQITGSLGLAFWSSDDRFLSSEELVSAADEQLYKAKHAGRNCVLYLE